MSLAKNVKEVLHDVFEINCDKYYPELLDEFEEAKAKIPSDMNENMMPDWMKALSKFDRNKPDKYWLEMAYQFAKLDLRKMLLESGRNAWPTQINMKADKSTWSQKGYPDGLGPFAATKMKHARNLYKWMRGYIPN